MRRHTPLAAILVAAVASAANSQVITQSYYSLEYEYFDGTNDSRVSAGPLLSGGLHPPSYFSAADVDYYHIDVAVAPSTLTVHVEGYQWFGAFGDPEVWIEDNAGNELAHHDDIAPGANPDAFLRYVFTTPGDYYVRVEHSPKAMWNYNYSNYTLWGSYQYPDRDPPTYDGEAGVRSAVRIAGDRLRSAWVTWHPATDNVSLPGEIKYNVYHSMTSNTVFLGSPAASYTGVLEGTVGGLSSDPATDYWFGVRAEDTAGNEEQNDRVVLALVPAAVSPHRWMLYR